MKFSRKKLNTLFLYSFLLALFSFLASIYRGFDLKFSLFVIILGLVLGGVLGYFAILLFSTSSNKTSDYLAKNLGYLNERNILVPLIIGGIFYLATKNFISHNPILVPLSLVFGWLIGLGIIKLFRSIKR